MRHSLFDSLGAHSLAISLSSIVLGMPAWAADYMWMSSPADAFWNTTSLNWNSGEAWVDGNNAIFGSSSKTGVTLDGARTVGNLTVGGSDYTISGDQSLTIIGQITSNKKVFFKVPLANAGGGMHFVCNDHTYLYKANTYTGGTYISGTGNRVLSLDAKDAALGAVPDSPQTNIYAMSESATLFAPGVDVELNANRHIWIKDGMWIRLAGQSKKTLRIKGEIRGEIPAGQNRPANTHLLARNDWEGRVVLDPGEGHTNDVGTLSSLGWLEIASGVTRVTSVGENTTGNGAAPVFVQGNGSAYNGYKGRLTLSGGELFVPPEQGYRRFHTQSYASVEIVGGKANMPKTEYLNALSGPSTLTIADGGELICREFRPSQANGAGGVVNLNKGGRLCVSVFRMDGASIATLNLNGGVIARQNTDFQESLFFGGYKSSANYANVTCKVLEGGAIFETPGNNTNLFINLPLKSGVAEGVTDGGLTMRGGGITVLTAAGSDYNGPTHVETGTRVQIRAANALPAGTTLLMGRNSEESTSIGFNTWADDKPDLAQTVARVEGCGRIYNNSLFRVSQAISPVYEGEYGTLTFEKPCSLNGDYEITGDANGCGCLKFEQAGQSISGLTLKVVDISAFSKTAPKSRYKILDAPNGYSGTFALGNVSGPWAVKYTPTAAYLHYMRGTSFTIR